MQGDEMTSGQHCDDVTASTQSDGCFFSTLSTDARSNVRYSLAKRSKSSEAVQELFAAALVEVEGGQRGRRLLQPEDHEGPAFLLHRDGPELADGEGQRPSAPLVAVVD